MLPFAYYLLKVILCSAVLFGYYWFALRNKVFHAYNRFYLLGVVAFSIMLPVMKFNLLHENENKPTVIKMLQVVNASDEYLDEIIIGVPSKSTIGLVEIIPFLYILISSVLFIILVQMIVAIAALIKKYKSTDIENIQFINTDAARGTPFSFFNYIFWNNQIDINSTNGNRIFKHEIAHVQEKHSWDKMFINLVLIVFWSNPIFWLIRKELSMIHEFIADKKAVEDGDTAAFAAMILQATYPQKNFYISNNFFYSPIKRRLMMLTKNQHPRMNYISRLLALPLLIVVFGAFTIKIANNINKEETTQKLNKKIVVVLDAGHGGQDGGAISKNGITEKDLVLQLVKKIKALNKDENIDIILSRDNDVFYDPKQKAAFAKAQNADIFISVHVDNGPKEKWNTVSGMSFVVAKDDVANAEKSKILASALIGAFKNNYALNVPSSPSQKKVAIWVLKANDFPSVLIEAGFLNNDKDLAYLQSEKGQEAFARNVLDAISKYASQKVIIEKTGLKKIIHDTIYFFNGKKINKSELDFKISMFNKLYVKIYKPIDAVVKFKTNNNETVIELVGRNEKITVESQLPLKNDTHRIVFTEVEVEPKFPGGESEWGNFLRKNIKANIPSDEGFKAGTYIFIFKFIVAADGTLSEFSTENYPDSKTAKHCIEILKNGPKWIPAKQNGHIVAAYRKQPITFVISEEMDDKEKVISQINQSTLNKQIRGAQTLED